MPQQKSKRINKLVTLLEGSLKEVSVKEPPANEGWMKYAELRKFFPTFGDGRIRTVISEMMLVGKVVSFTGSQNIDGKARRCVWYKFNK